MGRWALVVAGLLLVLSLSWYAGAQAPLPILRGIVVMPTGDSRAYFEDPQTGNLAGYAIRDVVGGSRIEEIRDDRVVLRHGGDAVHVFMGGASATYDRDRQRRAVARASRNSPEGRFTSDRGSSDQGLGQSRGLEMLNSRGSREDANRLCFEVWTRSDTRCRER